MEDLKKIKAIGLSKLNVAEYVNFMTNVITYIVQIGVNVIGVNPDILTAMENKLTLLYDAVAQSRINVETKKLQELDSRRDNICVYLLMIIRNATTSPISEEQQAGVLLYEQTKAYKGLQELPNDQQTVQIRALFVDLSKPQYQGAITMLRLNKLITELVTVNDEYATLSMARNENKDAAKLPDSKSLRAEMDKFYQHITDMAFVNSVSNPSEELNKFIDNINTAINAANTAFNQRSAQKKK